MTKTLQIVLAKAEQTALVETGRMVMRDMNWFPELRAEWEGKAAMWLNRGTEADVAKAERFAATEGYQVYTYPTSERDPLGKARAAAVKQVTHL